ncbi:MAG TPA: 2Fe-2S iron-sulfur cluster-binding protein [Spirochaetia bacterium]|nr:2Fe-2S iron-sulfur cluster-binding protein [Spirochaetia bacterium]
MPTISIFGRSEVFECDLTTSILNVLLRNRFPINTLCGGRAVCGKDVIRVREGAEFFSPKREREKHRLAQLAATGELSGDDIRLACQSYVRGNVVIEVLNIRGAEGARREAS